MTFERFSTVPASVTTISTMGKISLTPVPHAGWTATVLLALLTTFSGAVLGQEAGEKKTTRSIGAEKRRPPSKLARPGSTKSGRPVRRAAAPKGSATAKTPANGAPAVKPDGDKAPSKSDGGDTSITDFLRNYLWWIVGVAAVAGVITLAWPLLAKRHGKKGEGFLRPLGAELDRGSKSSSGGRGTKFSSTQIRATDVESRIGAVEGTKIETDREYALVVDEEALKVAVDEKTGKTYAPDEAIRQSIASNAFENAYEEYRGQVEDDGSIEFREDVETALSEYFLHKKDYRKAARILEHHVATHGRADIQPRIYFNLGYIHVLTKTYNKSRRFFRLFIKTESNSEKIARAKDILRKIDVKLGSARN